MLRGTKAGAQLDASGKIPSSQMPFTTGVVQPAANNVATSFSFAHGLSATPIWASVTAGNARSAGDFYLSWDATNITVTYLIAPTTGALSLTFIAVA